MQIIFSFGKEPGLQRYILPRYFREVFAKEELAFWVYLQEDFADSHPGYCLPVTFQVTV